LSSMPCTLISPSTTVRSSTGLPSSAETIDRMNATAVSEPPWPHSD
jgi:hypothetical protein